MVYNSVYTNDRIRENIRYITVIVVFCGITYKNRRNNEQYHSRNSLQKSTKTGR